jgi:hypothetical protein
VVSIKIVTLQRIQRYFLRTGDAVGEAGAMVEPDDEEQRDRGVVFR